MAEDLEAQAAEISPRELWERLHGRAGGRWYLLDVRNADEFSRWRAEGALDVPQVNVPYFEFIDDPGKALEKVPRDLGEAVVLCAKGDSSAFVKDVLLEAGLPAVHVREGMVGWGDLHVALAVEEGRGLELWQVSRYGKGCLSYVVVAGGEAAVVDPSRFVEHYERLARERGARIVEVLETHLHADHLSGGAELARRAGARYRVASGPGEELAFEGVEVLPLEDGAALRIGEGGPGIALEVLRTPGHTPGSTSFLVDGRFLLSGDTVFVHGVGRPDLGGHAEEWGRALHRSLREVLGALPADTILLPAHFAGAGEAEPGGLVRGRLGDVREDAPGLASDDPAEFVAHARERIRPAPEAYASIVRANLGRLDPGDDASEWELGKNECAAAGAHAHAPGASAPPLGEARRVAGGSGAHP